MRYFKHKDEKELIFVLMLLLRGRPMLCLAQNHKKGDFMRKRKLLGMVGISSVISILNFKMPVYATSVISDTNIANDVYVSEIDFADKSITAVINADREGFLNVKSEWLWYELQEGAKTTLSNMSISAIGTFNTNRPRLRLNSLWVSSSAFDGNTTDMIYYTFLTNDSNAKSSGVADFQRCTKSSVFLNGTATRCVAEVIEDGFLQYQPYDSDGNRIEIPADEDAFLTAKTFAWRTEKKQEITEEKEENESIEKEEESELVKRKEENVEKTEENKNITEYSTSLENSDGAGVQVEREMDELASYVSIVNPDKDTGIDYSENITNENQQDSTLADTVYNTIPADNVEVPILDKEQGENWLIPTLVATGLIAAGVCWWLLFFGKNKLTDRKEEKSID